MKTKMSFKRAALPVLATLLTAVISLTGVTYAWFTSGTTATVDQIDIGVVAADGLQIAVNTEGNFTWGSQYALEDPNMKNRTFSPLSGSADASGINLYTAVLDDTYDMISGFTKIEADNGAYITFDLYFRNMSTTAKNINIDGTEVFATTGNSHQAARIAFIKQASVIGSAANYSKGDFTNGSFVDNSESKTVVIYEPNANEHSASGIADYQKNYKNDATATEKFDYKAIVGTGTNGAYYNRYTGEYYVKAANRTDGTYVAPGVRTNATITVGNLDATGKYYFVSSASGSEFKLWNADVDYVTISADNALAQIAERAIYTKEGNTYTLVTSGANITSGTTYYVCQPVDVFTKNAADTSMETVTTMTTTTDTYFTLGANTVTKVTVMVWLEGQDADCNNATAGRPFSVALKFNSTTEQSGN